MILKDNLGIKSVVILKTTMLLTLLACFILQVLLDSSIDNIISNVLSLAAMYLTIVVVLKNYPQSFASALIGTLAFLLVLSNSLIPVIGTLLDGHSLVYSLIDPKLVFFHRFIFALIILLASSLTRNIKYDSLASSFSRLAQGLGINIIERERTIWLLGLLGVVIFFIKMLPLSSSLKAFLDGFNFLISTPFLLVLHPISRENYFKNNRLYFIGYFLLMILLSAVANSRMGIVGPLGVIICTWFTRLQQGRIVFRQNFFRKAFFYGIIGIYFVGVLADISTAILVSREIRAKASFSELISISYQNFQDKKTLDRYNQFATSVLSGYSPQDVWKEDYIRNPFLNRFCQIKFDDNLFYRLKSYSQRDKAEVVKVTWEKVAVLVPGPILDLFSVKIDKEYLTSFSMGDIMALLSGSSPLESGLGGYKTGSILANAYVVFGAYYPLFFFFFYYLLFLIFSGLVSSFKGNRLINNDSIFGLIICFDLFVGISVDGIPTIVGTLLRGIPQNLLILVIALYFSKKFK